MKNTEIIAAAMMANGITEESHTYNHWKQLGYQVRRGEHAKFRARIWRHGKRKVEDGDEEREVGRMFMKTAAFFTRSQVDAITTA